MYDYAIDFGGAWTTIFDRREGFVLKEPTMVAVEENAGNYKVKAFGKEAKDILWKAPDSVEVFNPISNGVIENYEYAQLMIKHFLSKIEFKKNKSNILVLVHCGLSKEERDVYKRLFEDVGFLDVDFIPSIICSAYGSGKNISSSKANIVVNIGGSLTDIATINLSSIVQGVTLGIGGKAMDIAIANSIGMNKKNANGLLIGLPTAERLKNEVGSLNRNDSLNMEVMGTDLKSKVPTPRVISATELRPVLEVFFDEIIRTIEVTVSTLPPEMTADIINNNIIFTGGVAKMNGLEFYLKRKMNYPFIIVDDPEDVTILGAGKLLSDTETLKKIMQNN